MPTFDGRMPFFEGTDSIPPFISGTVVPLAELFKPLLPVKLNGVTMVLGTCAI